MAAAAVLEVLRWVHLLAWPMPPSRSRASRWLVLGLIAGVAAVSATSTLAEQARADAKGLASELAVVLTTAGVQVVVLAVLWLALSLAMPRAARASTLYGSLGAALVLLVSLFLFARLAVAAAELNAILWERRRSWAKRPGRFTPRG